MIHKKFYLILTFVLFFQVLSFSTKNLEFAVNEKTDNSKNLPTEDVNNFITKKNELNPNPSVIAYAITASCSGNSISNDAYLQISSVDNATHYNFTTGSNYSTGDPNIANATSFSPLTDLPLQFGILPNPSSTQDYTIRVFNGAVDCFSDITVTLKNQNCVVSCDCEDIIYLNDPGLGINEVHKFRLLPDGSVAEIGSPWLAPDVPNGTDPLNAPHGAVIDLNGYVYIGDVDSFGGQSGGIVKLSCDGEVLEDRIAGPVNFGFNLGMIGNILYIPLNASSSEPRRIQRWDVCTGDTLPQISFSTNVWGFTVSRDKEKLYYSTGWFSPDNNQIIELNADGTGQEVVIYDSGDNIGTYMGLTQDDAGNFYVVHSQSENGVGDTRILKISPTGILLVATPIDDTLTQIDGATSGYNGGRGIVWSPSNNRVYVSSFEDCLSTFDSDLNYYPNLSVPYVAGGSPKAISLITECCPSSNRQTLDQIYCSAGGNEPIFLNELFSCEGTICEGIWEPADAFSAAAYDECNQSISGAVAEGCYSFSKTSDGSSTNGRCGAFVLEFNLEVRQVANITVSADQMICPAQTPETLTVTTSNAQIQWQSSTVSCTDGFSNIVGANSNTYSPPLLSQTTYYRAVVTESSGCSSGNCNFSSDCITIEVELSINATLGNQSYCINNRTLPDTSDDYFTVDINASTIGVGAQYEVVTGANADGTGGVVLGTENYGTVITVGSPGTLVADGTTVHEVTVRDATNNFCHQKFMTIPVGSCSAADFPDYSDPVRVCTNEPCHGISDDIYLGSSVDGDAAPNGSQAASNDVDDGLLLSPNMSFSPGNTVRIPVIVYNNTGNVAYLRMWIDWNGDGDFEDANEQTEDTTRPSLGAEETYLVEFNVPVGAMQNQELAVRTRLSTDDANSGNPCGSGNCAEDGEIEDYLIKINCKNPFCLPVETTIK